MPSENKEFSDFFNEVSDKLGDIAQLAAKHKLYDTAKKFGDTASDVAKAANVMEKLEGDRSEFEETKRSTAKLPAHLKPNQHT